MKNYKYNNFLSPPGPGHEVGMLELVSICPSVCLSDCHSVHVSVLPQIAETIHSNTFISRNEFVFENIFSSMFH